MYTRFFIESVIETGPVTKERNGDQKSGARLEPSPSELEIFLTCKSAQGESPLKLCLYSSNMTTAAVLIGLERNLGGKWNGFQIAFARQRKRSGGLQQSASVLFAHPARKTEPTSTPCGAHTEPEVG